MQDIEYYRSMNNIVKDFYVDFVHKFKDCFIKPIVENTHDIEKASDMAGGI